MSDTPPPLYCANHPNVETSLRCNICSKPICPKCAVLTPTGYRCRECVRGQQRVFDTAVWYDYPLAMVSAALLAFLGSLAVRFIGFFTLFLAPVIGVIIAEAVRLLIRKRRSNRLFQLTAIAAAVGSAPLLLMALAGLLLGSSLDSLLSLVWYGLYTTTVVSTLYYRLRGIQVR